MTLAIVLPNRDHRPLTRTIAALAPDIALKVWPNEAIDDAKFAVLWKQPANCLSKAKRLQAVMSFGAGVDFILNDDTLPTVPVGRVAGSQLAADITRYCLSIVLSHSRNLRHYHYLQQAQRWHPETSNQRPVVGVLGLGKIGASIAKAAADIGLSVHAWRSRLTQVDNVTVHVEQSGLKTLLGSVDYLINTLPLTEHTRDLLNFNTLANCAPGCWLINVGRGETVVDAELIKAIDDGPLAGASLDVFREEPLPIGHPFWAHPNIEITPHVAGLTDPAEAAGQIVESYRRVENGLLPLNVVCVERGY